MPGQLEVAYVLEDAIVALITAASTNGGKLNAQSQYAPVKSIERVAPPEGRLFPSIAIQFRRFESTAVATRREEVTAYYDLAVAVNQDFTPGNTGTLAAARAKLRPFIDDGAGNGLLELLRSQPQINGLCRRSKVLTVEEVALVTGASTAGSVVAALIEFQCVYPVDISV